MYKFELNWHMTVQDKSGLPVIFHVYQREILARCIGKIMTTGSNWICNKGPFIYYARTEGGRGQASCVRLCIIVIVTS